MKPYALFYVLCAVFVALIGAGIYHLIAGIAAAISSGLVR